MDAGGVVAAWAGRAVRIMRRRRTGPTFSVSPFPLWAGLTLLPIFFVGVVLVDWTKPPGSIFPTWVHVLLTVYWMSYFGARLSSGLWRRAMLRASSISPGWKSGSQGRAGSKDAAR
jgi:hypothetical protein